MSNIVESLLIEVEAKNADTTLSKVDKGLENVGDEAVRTEKRLGKLTDGNSGLVRQLATVDRAILSQVKQLAGLATAYFTLQGGIDALAGSIQIFIDFQATMASVQAVSQATAGDMVTLTEVAKELGASTQFSATQAAQGMELLGQAGFSVNEVVESMPGLLDLAASGQLDLASAADITSSVLKGFALDAEDAARVADVLALASAASNTDVQGLGEGMKYVAPVAASLKISLEDTAAAMGALSDAGLQGSMSGTGLRRVLADLVNPTKLAREELKLFGVNVKEIDPSANKLVDVVDRLAAAQIDAASANRIFGEAGAPVILSLIAQRERLRELSGELANAEGSADHMAGILRNTLKGSLDELQGSVETLRIEFGEAMEPALRAAAQELGDFFDGQTDNAREWGEAVGSAVTGVMRVFLALVENIDLVQSAFVALTVAFLAFKLGPLVLAAWEYVTALVALAAAEGAATVATMELSLAWQRLTAAMASNPIGIIAVALGLLAGAIFLAYQRHQEAAEAAEAYHRELREGKPAIEGVSRAHDEIAERLEREIAARQDLNELLQNNKDRLAQLEPVLEQMKSALAADDSQAYQQAVAAAERLGVALKDLGRDSALEQLENEVRALRAEADAAAARLVDNASRIASAEEEMARNIEQAVADEVRSRLEQIARIKELEAQAARAKQELDRLAAGPRGDSAIELMVGRWVQSLKNLQDKIFAAKQGLEELDGRVAGMRNTALNRAAELFSEGEFDRGAALARGVGVSEEEITRAISQTKAYNETLAEQKRKQEEAAREAEEAARAARELAREQGDLKKRFDETNLEITESIRGFDRIADAYRDGATAGRLMEAQIEGEAKAAQAASQFEGEYAEKIRARAREQVEAERRALGAKSTALLEEQIKAATALGEALRTGMAAAAEEARRKQELLARQTEQTTGAAAEQIPTLEDLAAKLFGLEKSNAFETQRRQLEDSVNSLREAGQAWDGTTISIEKATLVQQVNNEVHQATIGLVQNEAKEIAKLIRERERMEALFEARMRLGRLEEETRRLEELAQVKRSDFLFEKDYLEALRLVNVEHDVRSALLSVEFNRHQALAAVKREDFETEQAYLEALRSVNAEFDDIARRTETAVRRQADLNKEIDKGSRTVMEQADAWAQLAASIAAAAFGAESDIAKIIQGVVQLIAALQQAAQATDAVSAGMAGFAVGGAVVGLGQSAGLWSGDRGVSQFGGQRSGDYGDVGAQVGGVIGAVVGSFIPVIGTMVGAAVGAILGGIIGGFIKKGADEGIAELTLVAGQVGLDIQKAEGGLGDAVKRVGAAIGDAIEELVTAMGGVLEGLPNMGFKIRDDTIKVWVGDLERRFKDVDEAINWAVTEAVKQADMSGLSETMKTILQKTTAESLEQLARDLEFGRWYDRLGLPEVAVGIQDIFAQFQNAVRQANNLGLDTAKIGEWLGRQLQLVRNNLLGIEESPEDRLRRDIEAFNSQLLIIKAEQEARRADLLVQKTMLEAEIAILRAKLEAEGHHLQARALMVDAEGQLVESEFVILGGMVAALAAVDAALESVSLVLGSLPDLISDEELQAALDRLRNGSGGGKGGQKKEDQERLRGMLDDHDMSGASDYAKRLQEINDKWAEAVPLAHGNKELLAQINEARREEIAALRQQVTEELYGRIKDFERDPFKSSGIVDGFNELRKRGADLRKDFLKTAEDMGWGADRIAAGLARITAAEDRHMDFLAQQGFADLAGNLASIITDEGIRQELIRQQETITFTMKMIQYQAEYEALKASGKLTAEQVAALDASFQWIRDNAANLPGGANWKPGGRGDSTPRYQGYDGGGSSQNQVPEWMKIRDDMAAQAKEWRGLGLSDLVKEAQDLRSRYDELVTSARRWRLATGELDQAWTVAVEDFVNRTLEEFEHLGESDLNRRLREMNEQFADIAAAFQAIGAGADASARLEEARAAAFAEFWKEATSSAQELLEDIRSNNPSVRSGERIQDLQAEFANALLRVQGGDLSGIEDAVAAADRLRELGADFFGTSSGAFQNLLSQIETGLQGLVDMGVPDNVAEQQLNAQEQQVDLLQQIADQLAAQAGLPAGVPLDAAALAALQAAVTQAVSVVPALVNSLGGLAALPTQLVGAVASIPPAFNAALQANLVPPLARLADKMDVLISEVRSGNAIALAPARSTAVLPEPSAGPAAGVTSDKLARLEARMATLEEDNRRLRQEKEALVRELGREISGLGDRIEGFTDAVLSALEQSSREAGRREDA